jgi:methyl-accepting chemotaxis protein
VHALLGQMATDNQAQSTAITQIASAIQAMDHSTQQNAAMVEQSAAAARSLASEVAALGEQAGKFEVGVAARTRVPSRPQKANGYASPAKPLAAPKPMARATTEEWASF